MDPSFPLNMVFRSRKLYERQLSIRVVGLQRNGSEPHGRQKPEVLRLVVC